MHVKVHESYRKVIAICDSDLLGKKFEEGKLQLDVRESFYGGREVSEEELSKIMEWESSNDSTFNIVGEKSVDLALKEGVISEGNVSKISDIPFALLLI